LSVWLAAALLVLGLRAQAVAHASPTTAWAPTFRVSLTADDHRPTAGEAWHFSVRASTTSGRPISGTVLIQVLMGGRVADTIGLFRFSGVHETAYRWSPALAGATAFLQATVVTADGARRVRLAVNVVGKTGRPQFRVTLSGDGHSTQSGDPWHYRVRARDARGRPIGATAVVRVIVGGQVVDTIGWFRFRGGMRRAYRWSLRLQNTVALLQVRLIGPGGARTVGYMVRVL